MATGVSASDLTQPLVLLEHAKQVAKQHRVNESLIGSRDVAIAYLDRYLGSGAEASQAYVNILNWDLPLGT